MSERRTTLADERTTLAKSRTDWSQSRTEWAEMRNKLAEIRTRMSGARTGLAQSRTNLSQYRTLLAKQRTELSYLRTGLTFIAIGTIFTRMFGLGYWSIIDAIITLAGLSSIGMAIKLFVKSYRVERKMLPGLSRNWPRKPWSSGWKSPSGPINSVLSCSGVRGKQLFRTAMTIRKRILVAAVIQAVVICLICGFGYVSFKVVLTKLQAIEIIDDLNISLLEMRKAEKNYFLYKDLGSLKELISIGRERYTVLQSSRSYLVSGLHGLSDVDYASLLNNLKHYVELIQQALNDNKIPAHTELEIRKLGHDLTQQSASLLAKERKTVSYIISYNIIMLIVSLGVIFVIQVVLWQYFFRFLIKEISTMEHMIHMVSEGRFHEVATQTFAPHNEIQIAVKAVSDMAGSWRKESRSWCNRGSWRRWAS